MGDERREEEGGEKKRKKKTKPLNGKTALPTCGQHVPHRLQEAAGAQVRERHWLGSSSKKHRSRMGDSRTPGNRRGLEVHKPQQTVCCPSAANSAWSPGRANAWTLQGMLFFHLSWFWLVVRQKQEFTELCACCIALLHFWCKRGISGLFLSVTASGGFAKVYVFRENF